MTPPDILIDLFLTAVAAAQPARCIPTALPPVPRGRTIVIGAGKASAEMAAQLEAVWQGELQGTVVTRYGHGVPCKKIRVLEAGHPVPDENSFAAAREMRRLVTGLNPDDLVISLISGGGSSLLVEPAPGVRLSDKQAITRELMLAGATISEMNRVRQALSAVKGGRLAAAAFPAKVVTLVISDVPGDDPALIASGPTVAPNAAHDGPLEIVERLGVTVAADIRAVLANYRPPFCDFSHCETRLIATPIQSLNAAAERARELGLSPLILSDCIEGEARETAQVHAGIAQGVIRHGTPVNVPAVVLSGGETRVTLGTGRLGRGGRNTEFLLALGLALRDEKLVYALACDTDGSDGSEDNAGAIWLPDSVERAEAAGLDLRELLQRHDAYGAFAALGNLVVTGPTRTNVNDFRAILLL